MIGLRLTERDGDIERAISNHKNISRRIRELIRLGIWAEQAGLTPETQFLRQRIVEIPKPGLIIPTRTSPVEIASPVETSPNIPSGQLKNNLLSNDF